MCIRDSMEGYALREGAGIPVRANRTGNIVSSGDYPVLAVKNGTAITSSAENGAAESVEYDIMRLSCELAGINLTIGDIMVAEMNAIEELMVFGPEGITSVLSCSGHYYYNLVCDRIEQVLPRINKAFHAKYGNTL